MRRVEPRDHRIADSRQPSQPGKIISNPVNTARVEPKEGAMDDKDERHEESGDDSATGLRRNLVIPMSTKR